jgi:hypothetical protein
LRITEELDDRATSAYLHYGLGLCHILRQSPEPARASLARSLTYARQADDHTLISYAVLGVALTVPIETDAALASQLEQASSALFASRGEVPEPLEFELRQTLRDHLDEVLGPDWVSTATLSPELDAGRIADLALQFIDPTA